MSTLLTFGKYLGTDVRTLADADRNYAFWLMAQPWFKLNHPAFYSALRRVIAKRLTAEVQEERWYAERALLPSSQRFNDYSRSEFIRGDYLA